MDRSNNGAYSRTQNISSGRALEGRSSVESQRLQKKKSNAGVRNASQPLPLAAAGGSTTAFRSNAPGMVGAGAGGKARKSSLRETVRKIFGRRSKELEPQPLQRSPPRHGYHRSEPPALATTIEASEQVEPEQSPPQRTLSAPLHIIPPPAFQRTRSPYAVEFPQSARLKPLDLGNPFSAPGSQLRRRKTLPSVLLPESDAAAVAASIGSTDPPPVPSLDITRDTPTPDFGLAANAIKSSKRRSRSASDLKSGLAARAAEASAPRKRDDDIRYWRESFQGSVLRASGFVSKVPRDEEALDEQKEDKTPTAKIDDPFDARAGATGTYGSSPPFRHGPSLSDPDMGSTSAIGTELSRDLEDRVAKLEAGLHTFQRSLQRLTADRNRRTVIMGGVPQRRLSTDARTPSMLADTLADFAPSAYEYGFEETQRPSTSPQPPRTPVRSTDTTRPAVPPLPRAVPAEEPFATPSPQAYTSTVSASQVAGSRGGNGNGNGQTQQYTFRSLYEMLADERSARYRLELQLRSVRREVLDLQYQVSVGSQVQSQRSSFIPLDPAVGSSRLRDLLRDTESSPPGTAQTHQQARESDLTATSSHQPGVSRFSGSESEVTVAEGEGLMTPYEAYQTPREERSRFPFNEGEAEMF